MARCDCEDRLNDELDRLGRQWDRQESLLIAEVNDLRARLAEALTEIAALQNGAGTW